MPLESKFVRKLSSPDKRLAVAKFFPSVPQEPEISLLIGAYYVWELLTKNICLDEEEQCLAAVNPMFGWTLQGPH